MDKVELRPLENIAQVSTAIVHTCALTKAGGVKCWGWNTYWEPDDGTTGNRTTPVDIPNLGSGVTAITTGGFHTCALINSGGVKCWGSNLRGQLGDNTTIARYTPVDVIGLSSGVVAISAGYMHTCALTSGGGVKCWGYNLHGQLGDGTTTFRYTPVDVIGLSSGVIAISTGSGHTCALTTVGGIKCWGENYAGQLGDGTTVDWYTPVDVVGINSGVTAISAGYNYSCAITSVGGVKCWGRNDAGNLGNGTNVTQHTPVDVIDLSSGVTSVSTGLHFHTCALTFDGGVKCWGDNYYGQLGDNTTIVRYRPVDVVGLNSDVTSISVGEYYACVVTSADGVKCWGYNGYGQLGDGSIINRHTPVDVMEEVKETTPTPTDTPTPIPTPDITPTPTPTLDTGKHPMIFILGFPGSQLQWRTGVNYDPTQDFVLWPTLSPIYQAMMTLKDGGDPMMRVYPSDAIREFYPLKPFLGSQIYSPFIDRMIEQAKYQEYLTGGNPELRVNCDFSQTGKTLFIFPWDFRRGVTDQNINLLAQYINCARQLNGGKDVDIVAHSMGGLLAQSYVLAHPQDHHVRTFIDIATPWLGAPKGISALLTGELDTMTNLLIWPFMVRGLTEHFRGAHQLLPSETYFAHTNRPPLTLTVFDRQGQVVLPETAVTYATFGNALQRLYRAPALFEPEGYVTQVDMIGHNRELHSERQLYDWAGADPQINYHVIYGIHWGQTLGQLRAIEQNVCDFSLLGSACRIELTYHPLYVVGDGTVPALSARKFGPGFNYNGSAQVYLFRDNPESASYESAEHLGLTQNASVQWCIYQIVQGLECPDSVVTAAADGDDEVGGEYPLKYINLWGINSLYISDGISTTRNLITSTLSLNSVPGVKVEYMGDNAVEIIFLATESYTVTFESEGVVFATIEDGTNNITPTQSIKYVNVNTPVSTTMQLESHEPLQVTLSMDTDGDGLPETVVPPTGVMDAEDLGDTTAPVVSAFFDSQSRVLSLSASDEQSGVARIFYSLDSQQLYQYEQPVTVEAGIDIVWAQAEDVAGNISELREFPLQGQPLRTFFLPLVSR